MKPNEFIKIIIRGNSAERLASVYRQFEFEKKIMSEFGIDDKDFEISLQQEYN